MHSGVPPPGLQRGDGHEQWGQLHRGGPEKALSAFQVCGAPVVGRGLRAAAGLEDNPQLATGITARVPRPSPGGVGGGGGESWDNGWKSFDKPKASTGKWDTSKDSDDDAEVEKAEEFSDSWPEPKSEGKSKLPRRPSGGGADWASSESQKPAKVSKPIKKVDLGASAALGKAAQQKPTTTQQPAQVSINPSLTYVYQYSIFAGEEQLDRRLVQ